MHYLSLVGIFKNESHGIREWVEHYINEGVDHFYLIDNGSTDYYKKEIQEFIDSKLITIIRDDTKWAQKELYNKYFLPLKKESEWFLVVDLDEFVYARNGFETIADFLKSRSKFVGLIRIPWKIFGSSGLVKQPTKIVDSFVKRSRYDGLIKPGMNRKKKSLGKVIVRNRFLKKIHIHSCDLYWGCLIINANGELLSNFYKHHQQISEEILQNSYLQLNHYAIQSLEWFREVKSKRGAADGAAHEEVRNQKYFDDYDSRSNDIKDLELADKQRNRS